jgi:hypothetical protein
VKPMLYVDFFLDFLFLGVAIIRIVFIIFIYDTHTRTHTHARPQTQFLPSLQMRIPLPKGLLPFSHRHQVGVACHDPVEVPPQRPAIEGAARLGVGAQAEKGRGDEAVVDALRLGEPALQPAVDVGVRDL